MAEKEIMIGYVKSRGERVKPAVIPVNNLFTNIWVVGEPGTGKTTLLINTALQAYAHGFSVVVLDIHGDMTWDIVRCLKALGSGHLRNLILLDPQLTTFSTNPQQLPEYRTQIQREFLLEQITFQQVEFFRDAYGERSIGPRSERTFTSLARFLYKISDNPTLSDIYNILVGNIEELPTKVTEHQDFQKIRGLIKNLKWEGIDPVVNKIQPFVESPRLRSIFCARKGSFDFNEITKPGRITVFRIAKGEIGLVFSKRIGSAILLGLRFHIFLRPPEQRTPVLIAMDEWQNFVGLTSIEDFLSEGRKFRCGLVLCNQTIGQFSKDVRKVVAGCCATKICFKVSGEDATYLARDLDITQQRKLIDILTHIPRWNAVLGRERPSLIETLPMPRQEEVDLEQLLEAMKQKYGAPPPTAHLIQTPPKISEEFSEEMVGFLRAVSRVGQEGKFRLYKSMKMSAKRFDALIKKAESRNLITIHEVKTGGRPLKAVTLTEKGQKVIRKFLGRKGGVWHQRAIQKVMEYHQRLGDRAFQEMGGRAEEPDLTVIARDGRKIIWQFERKAGHPDQVLKNFENFRSQCDFLRFGVPNDSVGQRVIKILGSKGYELRRDYFIYKIHLDEEKGVENVY